MAALCLAVALSAGAVSAAGVFLRGSGAAVEVVSPRGERYPMATDGVYAWNAQRVVAEGVGWDLFTLAVVVPALLLATPLLARGSFRGRLLALGLLAYLFYQYLMYAVTWAFGPLFLPFVAVYAASLAAIVAVASSLARDGVAGRFDDGYPRRGMAVLCFLLAAALVAMWLARIAAGLRGDLAGAMLLGQTTMVVQALDLGLVVPLAVLTGVLCWRRHAGRPGPRLGRGRQGGRDGARHLRHGRLGVEGGGPARGRPARLLRRGGRWRRGGSARGCTAASGRPSHLEPHRPHERERVGVRRHAGPEPVVEDHLAVLHLVLEVRVRRRAEARRPSRRGRGRGW